MPTKYVDVQGYATYFYYTGKTTIPEVVPDFSRGRKVVMLHAAGNNVRSTVRSRSTCPGMGVLPASKG